MRFTFPAILLVLAFAPPNVFPAAEDSKADANVILASPKVNQVGYLLEAAKIGVVSAPHAKSGNKFQVVDEKGRPALQGRLGNRVFDETAATGEKVLQADFSSLTAPGKYRLVVRGEKSASFSIASDVYQPLFRDSLRTFFLNRCGVALDDARTGLKHAACHLGDAPLRDDPAKKLDLTGGWHNAGDYGKWTLEEAVSCSWMMWLVELKGDSLPAPAPGDPTLLDEARWGLTWMLKMQRPDGSVWHKVDPEKNFCFGTAPEKDATPRAVANAGSIDAAVFCGAMCQASRVFRPSDPAFADRCLSSAKKAWKWLEAHPREVQSDFAYQDADPSQEALWALGEMVRVTGDPALADRFSKEANAGLFQPPSWQQPQFFGFLAVLTAPETPAAEKDRLGAALRKVCDDLTARSDANGYGVVTAPGEYYWESNETLLHRTAVLLAASEVLKEPRYRAAALRQMDWLLGANSLDLSFVTGHGEKAVSKPYHWAAAAYDLAIPGWAAGGPNQYPGGADPLLLGLIGKHTPPAKCFVDAYRGGSWASNEGETSEEAALVFASGCLSSQR